MRILAKIARLARNAKRGEWIKAIAAARGRRTGEDGFVLDRRRLPSSSMLRGDDNENLRLRDEDRAG